MKQVEIWYIVPITGEERHDKLVGERAGHRVGNSDMAPHAVIYEGDTTITVPLANVIRMKQSVVVPSGGPASQ